MQSLGVIDLIDEVRKIRGDVLERLVRCKVNGFDLQGLHETLSLGIVVGIGTTAH